MLFKQLSIFGLKLLVINENQKSTNQIYHFNQDTLAPLISHQSLNITRMAQSNTFNAPPGHHHDELANYSLACGL